MLNICIPTYNRLEYLIRLLDSLRQAGAFECSDIQVTVFDNASAPPVRAAIDKSIRVVVNKNNIGSVGNIIKCLEYASDGWLWIIGDDDLVAGEHISNALNAAKRFQDCALIYFSNKFGPVATDGRTSGVADFASRLNLETFGGRLWISSQMLNASYTRDVIRHVYYYPASSPHFTWALMNSDKTIGFSASEIAIHTMADRTLHWHVETILAGLTQTLNLPIDGVLRRQLANIYTGWIQDFPKTMAKIIACRRDGHEEIELYESNALLRYLTCLSVTRRFDDIRKVVDIFSRLDSFGFVSDLEKTLAGVQPCAASMKGFKDAI